MLNLTGSLSANVVASLEHPLGQYRTEQSNVGGRVCAGVRSGRVGRVRVLPPCMSSPLSPSGGQLLDGVHAHVPTPCLFFSLLDPSYYVCSHS